MATATLSKTQHVPETAKHSTQTESVIVNGAASGTLSTLDALSSNIGTWAQDILDRSFPPDQRQAFLAKIKAFVLANPKISAFLGMNIALTGIPLGLFTLFGLSVAIFSVLSGITIGLIGAALVTLTCVGVALAVVFPILMFTTASACTLFLFGFGGYKVLEWATTNNHSDSQTNGEKSGVTVGDSLNPITCGRLAGLRDSPKPERDKSDISIHSDENTPPQQPPSKMLKGDLGHSFPNQTHVGKVTKRTLELTTVPAAPKTSNGKTGNGAGTEKTC